MDAKTLLAQYEAKNAEVKTLLANPEITQEDVIKAQALNVELAGIRESIEKTRNEEKALNDLKASQAEGERFLNEPETKLALDGVRGGSKFLGSTPAGTATIEQKGKDLFVTDDGDMLIDQKVRAVISSKTYKEAFNSYLRKGQNGVTAAEYKTLQEGVDTSGGFLVPEDILSRIVMKAPTPTRIRGYVTTLNTGRDALTIPRVNYASATDDSNGNLYTTGVRSTWTGEVPASATTARVTDPLFGQLRIPVNTNMMSMPLTNDIIEDALFPLVSWASDRFSETIDLLYDNMILNGNGLGQPSGILLNPGGADQPGTVNVGNPVTADGVEKVAWSLPEQYDMNARWVINKTSVGQAVALLKDGNGRYLWGSGIQDSGLAVGGLGNGQRVLAGYPVNFSGFAPSTGAANNILPFGDFSGYYLVNRVGFSVQVLRELYAETNQVLLLGRIRFGGQVAEAWKIKIGVQS